MIALPKSKRVRWFALLAVVAIGVAAFLIVRRNAARDDEAATGQRLTVERGDLIETADASGRIEPHLQVEVKSRASGEVIGVFVEEGESVEKGQLLVRLDPRAAELNVEDARATAARLRAELLQAGASISAAEAEAQEAIANRDLQRKGVDLGVVAAERARTAESSGQVATANVSVRQAQRNAARAMLRSALLAIDDAERQLAETEIHAPFAGTILSVGVEAGSTVSSALINVAGGSPIVTLADLSDLRVTGKLDESQVGRVKAGQSATVRVDAYPDRSFKGRVEHISPLGVEVSNVVTFDVEIVITDDDAELLRSGMSADVEIVTARRKGVLLVPLIAVRSQGRRRFVQLGGGELRDIQTGSNDGQRLEVIEGLKEGDEVLVRGEEKPPEQGGFFRPRGGKR